MVDATARVPPSVPPVARDLYVLETWGPSEIARLLKSQAALERTRQENSWRAWAKRRFGFECPELVQRGQYELYRCQRSGLESGSHGR
jgi:hypothetical protein